MDAVSETREPSESELARLRQSETQFRRLFEAAQDGILIVNADTAAIEAANPFLADLLGYSLEEMRGKRLWELSPFADVKKSQISFHELQRKGHVRHADLPLETRDGRSVPVEFVSNVYMAGGRRIIQCNIRDISARKQMEAQLLQSALELGASEERMRFAMENANVGIWDMDYATGVLRWSEILEAQYGLQPRTFGGTFEAFRERIHPDDRSSVLESIGKASTLGTDFTTAHRIVRPDGTVRWLRGAGRIVLGEHGEPIRGVGVSMDETERHMMEARYQQSQKMEAIGRLAGGVAHDFNNLLTAILAHCELISADHHPGDPHQADVEGIQKAASRAAGLTRQLLAFSRKQIIEPTLLNLDVVVAELQPMLERVIGEDVKILTSLQSGLARVKADRGQVEQVIVNLAVNARDAMPAGGTLTIGSASVFLDEQDADARRSVPPGDYVALTVTDTGTGITPEAQAHLFEPFFTTKEVGKGTGLGLATVHGSVIASGGSIEVSSEVGVGTSFKVYYPKAGAADTEVEAPRPVGRLPGGTETVLVVEDEAPLRELTRRLLERLGYTVLLAKDAEEALELSEGDASIDVVLTDVVMPRVSGPELTRQLVERRPLLKVIYMSGYTDDAIVHHGILEPGISFVNKPFSSETLGRKIRQALDA